MDDMIKKFHESYTPVTESGCWIWNECGGDKVRYGSLWNPERRVMERANRFSYKIHKGDIPEGLVVRHTCDVSFCVNPNHLVVGTQQDNVNDTVSRGRLNSRKGEKNGRAVLTEDNVKFILSQPIADGHGNGVTHKELADTFGVSKGAIEQIRRRVAWNHIEYDPK